MGKRRIGLVMNAVNAYGQDEGLQKMLDRVDQAKEQAKEIKTNLDKLFANARSEPDVLAKEG